MRCGPFFNLSKKHRSVTSKILSLDMFVRCVAKINEIHYDSYRFLVIAVRQRERLLQVRQQSFIGCAERSFFCFLNSVVFPLVVL